MRKTPAPLSVPVMKTVMKPTAGIAVLEKPPLKVMATSKTPSPRAVPVKAAPAKAALVKPAPVAIKPAVKLPTLEKKPAPKAALAKASTVKPAAVAIKAPKVVAETPATYFAGAAGRAWRMSGKHAVAYVHTAALAGELLQTEPRQVAGFAMAIYYDRKGRAFAWQFRFDTARWAEVTGRLL